MARWMRLLGMVWLTLGSGALACNVVLGIDSAETVEGLSGSGGTSVGCVKDSECDDSNVCTTDRCSAGNCANTPADGDLPEQVAGDCKTARCVNGNSVDEADDSDLPVDDDDCTDDVCSSGVASNPNRAEGQSCMSDGGNQCNGGGSCVECLSNMDCNSPLTCNGAGVAGFCGCTASITCTSEGLSCGSLADDGCGKFVNCNDSVANGDETDVDCGGPSVLQGGSCDLRCQTGDSCTQNLDCVSGTCTNNLCT